MKTKVIITIDTEPDNQWDPALRKAPRFENILELNKLQKLFNRFQAKPTYLVAYSVIKSAAISALKDIAISSSCEIGAHLHAWETPPFERHIKGDGSYLHQYSYDAQRRKMKNLDSLISESFGRKAVSYRGGRYSFDKNTIPILAEYGYLIDTTVTPGISWENDGGTNFKKFVPNDYFIRAAGKNMLEVPVSIKIRSRLARLSKAVYLNTPDWVHAQGILMRAARFNIIWLDPSFNTYEDMKWACDTFLRENVSFLNIMFHSSVIIPGGSPYTDDEQKTRLFFQRLENLLGYLLNSHKLESFTLKEFYQFRKGFKQL